MTLSIDREARNVETLIKRISGESNFLNILYPFCYPFEIFLFGNRPARLVIEFRRLIQIAAMDERPFELWFNGFKGEY